MCVPVIIFIKTDKTVKCNVIHLKEMGNKMDRNSTYCYNIIICKWCLSYLHKIKKSIIYIDTYSRYLLEIVSFLRMHICILHGTLTDQKISRLDGFLFSFKMIWHQRQFTENTHSGCNNISRNPICQVQVLDLQDY